MAERRLKIALTGATGQVGGAVLRQLMASQHSVLLLVRDTHNPALPKENERVRIVHAPLDNIPESASRAVVQFSPDVMVHAAWMGTENTNRNQPEFVAANLQSCLRLFALAKEAGCRQWVGFGSQAEYSPAIETDITETSPTFPDSAYGAGKLAACHMLQALGTEQNIVVTWLRIFASYGHMYKASYVIPYLLECFRNRQIPVFKTPRAVWDYIHLDDVAAAMLAALAQPEAGGIFNLGSGVGHSIADIALMLAEMTGFEDMSGLRAAIANANGPASRRVADIRKIKQKLQWTPAITLREGLKTCL